VRVLVLHSRYLSGPTSGENRVVEDEVALLREGGVEVDVWAPEVRGGGARAALDAVWSRSAADEATRRVARFAPDVVHVHSLYPRLSPAALRAAEDTPVVMTLHNFRLQCLPATFLRERRICEDCLGRVPWRGVVHGCYRGSRAASAVLATSLAVHRAAGSFDRVTRFLAVSAFVRAKHVEAGIAPERILVKPNFAQPLPRRQGPGVAFLTLGRLSPEKGLAELLAAWPALALDVVGDGPERERLRALAPPTVTFAGQVAPDRAAGALARARALLYPSRCYEAQPRAILEAFAAGVPVIASRIGGLPELVEHGVNGLLVDVDDAKGWREAVERLMDDAESERLGEGAYRTWQERFTPEIGLRNLLDAYRVAIAAHHAADDEPMVAR
jgi:glycosyltransferase involved in cell wall biosynthesis